MKKSIKSILSYLFQLARQYERESLYKNFNIPSSVAFNELSLEGSVTIGEHTYLNDFTRLDSGLNSKISIGKHCAIGRFVHITSKTHDLKRPTTDSNITTILHNEADVIVGNCVWIGDHATILPGVVIGDYAVIGAHSLVKQNVRPFEIVGGIPARHIRFNTRHEKFSEK
jgi:maltose O-acetyltransferase